MKSRIWSGWRPGSAAAALAAAVLLVQSPGAVRSVGEDGGVLVLSLKQSKRIALSRNRDLKSIEQEAVVARGKIVASRARALPSLTLGGNYTHLGVVPSAEFDMQSFSFGEEEQYTVTATLRQALYKGGRVGAGLRIARLYEDVARRMREEALQSVVYEVTLGYYDVLLARELLDVSEKTFLLARRHHEDLEKKGRHGLVSDYDVLRARVEVANAEAVKIARQNSLRTAGVSFIKVLGLPLDTRVELSDELACMPFAVILTGAVDGALTRRPEIGRQELTLAMRAENVIAIAADMKIGVDLVANWEGGNSTRFALGAQDWADGWDAGVEFSLPLFDGLRTRGRIREERARLRQDELALEELRETVRLEVTQAVLKMEDAGKLVVSQEENVKRAEEGLRLAGVRYDGGEATELEVMDAREALARAGSNYSTAVYEHMRARLEFERAVGMLAGEGAGESSDDDYEQASGSACCDHTGRGRIHVRHSEGGKA